MDNNQTVVVDDIDSIDSYGINNNLLLQQLINATTNLKTSMERLSLTMSSILLFLELSMVTRQGKVGDD